MALSGECFCMNQVMVVSSSYFLPAIMLFYLLSFRGMVYASLEVDPGWIVRCQGHLLMRRKAADSSSDQPWCSILDHSSLKVMLASKLMSTTQHDYCNFAAAEGRGWGRGSHRAPLDSATGQ